MGPTPTVAPARRLTFVIFLALIASISMVLFGLNVSFVACTWLVRSVCYHGYQSDYSFDAGASLRQAWMAAIPDATNLSSISLPGTHDTMTYNIESEGLQCQNHNLSTQLRAGLRYLDIRARVRGDTLGIYHSFEDTGFTYTDVLLTAFAFLEENPTETIIMRLKEEGPRVREDGTEDADGQADGPTFEEVFDRYRLEDPETAPGCKEHLYMPDSFDRLPTLGELRGKILVLQNFPSRQRRYGVQWDGQQMILEDLWIIPSVEHLWMKWDAIRDALKRAALTPDDNSILFLSHLSASVGVLPIEAAAGPLNNTILGMNDETGEWLKDGAPEGKLGVVIIDFPGKELIDEVLRRNDHLGSSEL